MFCSAVSASYGFGNGDFKLEYSGISVNDILSGVKIVYYTPQKGFIVEAAQKIADHIWQALKQSGETNHVVYIIVNTIVNPNGSIFVKLTTYIHNNSNSFGAKKAAIFINRYAPANNLIDNLPWKLVNANCGIPEGFQGKSPRHIIATQGQRPTIDNP